MQTETCLVLMFKSPHRSKQRLAAEIGARAQIVATHLFECAAADLAAWDGPVCFAPADTQDIEVLETAQCDNIVEQGPGNLGERINRVNRSLLQAGYDRQIFIGIDCPALDRDYLQRADMALRSAGVVFGPAHDGGVVLMGIAGHWPDLSELPWSTGQLGDALIDVCRQSNLSVQLLEAHSDVDCKDDLKELPKQLHGDQRETRQRLCEWVEAESFA